MVLAVELDGSCPDGSEAKVPWRLEVVEDSGASSSGVSLLTMAHTACGSVLCRSAQSDRKEDPSAVGARVARQLLEELAHGGCTDEFATDQVLVFAALAAGESRVRCGPPSLHTTTAAGLVSALLPGATVAFERTDDGGHLMRVGGIGLPAK